MIKRREKMEREKGKKEKGKVEGGQRREREREGEGEPRNLASLNDWFKVNYMLTLISNFQML
jgi:hypothetical protein